jgi:hypothetical protein
MRFIISSILIGALLFATNIYGQEKFNSKILPQIEFSQKEYAKRSIDEKKLQYGLFELLQDAEAADTSIERKQHFIARLKNTKIMKVDSDYRVRIVIDLTTVENSESVVNLIENLNGIIERVGKTAPMISCRLHPKKLRKLVSSTSVKAVRISREGHARSIISAGDSQ